jgi:hypothetical protein
MVKSLRAAPLRTAGEKDSRTIKAALDRQGTLTTEREGAGRGMDGLHSRSTTVGARWL